MRPNPLIAVAFAAILTWPTAIRADDAVGLSVAEFEKLHGALQSPREPWEAIPWKLSVLEARDQAAKEKKPVYMLCRSGHPLGCV